MLHLLLIRVAPNHVRECARTFVKIGVDAQRMHEGWLGLGELCNAISGAIRSAYILSHRRRCVLVIGADCPRTADASSAARDSGTAAAAVWPLALIVSR